MYSRKIDLRAMHYSVATNWTLLYQDSQLQVLTQLAFPLVLEAPATAAAPVEDDFATVASMT